MPNGFQGFDTIRCEIEGMLIYAGDDLERQVAAVLLEAYDRGELGIERDVSSGQLLFSLKE
jgi:hypothetical protein